MADVSGGPVRHRGTHARYLLLALLPPIVLTQSIWAEGGLMREGLEWLGYVAVVVCVLGRAWCSAYIAGRKNSELVDRGPYSLARNPLYGFSAIGLTGIGLQTGSLTWAALLLLGCCLYFGIVVRREESHLLRAFPDARGRATCCGRSRSPTAAIWPGRRAGCRMPACGGTSARPPSGRR